MDNFLKYLTKRIPYKRIDVGFDNAFDFSNNVMSILFTCRSYSIKLKKSDNLATFIIIKGDKKGLFRITGSCIDKESYVMNKINNTLLKLAQ